tara:strand:- start:502 stop:942 length:441 start_codon:yes stop_codon:yes gene_type:complete
MESIIGLIFLTLFVILIYNYSLYYFKYHKDTKKQYISYKNNKERFTVGGFVADIDKSNCDSHQCQNNSSCVPTDTGYECRCNASSGVDPDGTPFSGRTFSGTFCEFQNDKSVGVRVILDDSEMVPQIVYTRKPMFDTQNFQWNDFI